MHSLINFLFCAYHCNKKSLSVQLRTGIHFFVLLLKCIYCVKSYYVSYSWPLLCQWHFKHCTFITCLAPTHFDQSRLSPHFSCVLIVVLSSGRSSPLRNTLTCWDTIGQLGGLTFMRSWIGAKVTCWLCTLCHQMVSCHQVCPTLIQPWPRLFILYSFFFSINHIDWWRWFTSS